MRNQYVYDAAGRQRFAFLPMGAPHWTRYEERVYFGDAGDVVQRVPRPMKRFGFPSVGIGRVRA